MAWLTAGAIAVLPALAAVQTAQAQTDDMPVGIVALFSAEACPLGWQVADYGQGRLIVAVKDGALVGGKVGTALTDAEDREHRHHYSGKINLSYKSIAAASSCCNGSATKKGEHPYSGDTMAETSGLPFVQFTICEKQ